MKRIVLHNCKHAFEAKLSFCVAMLITMVILPLSKIGANNLIAQNQELSIDFENVTVEHALDEIESITDYSFVFANSVVDLDRKLTIKVKNKTVNSILRKIFNRTKTTYFIEDTTIFLVKKSKRKEAIKVYSLLKSKEEPNQPYNKSESPKIAAQRLTSIASLYEDFAVRGQVLDPNGQPLIGATILEKGTTNGTVTDVDGNFSLNVQNENAILIVSYLGYIPKEVSVNGNPQINVTLEDNTAALEEVVVVGFGTKKKANVTGATNSVDMADILANRPITNTIQAMQGTVPGLQITTNSGQPGDAGLDINIRGFTSINGGAPLILMNNVPVTVEDINPQDVESVTVLKDAAAASIYGARAAFGVILITTKQGAKNTPIKFNYSNTFSFSEPEDIPNKASPYLFVKALNDWNLDVFWTGQDVPTWLGFLEEYRDNPSAYPEGFVEFDGLRYPLAETDVIGEWLNNDGFTQIHNLNFSGGGDNIQYRVSGAFSDEDGIIVTDNDSYQKYNLNAFLKADLTPRLASTINVIYRNSERRRPLGSYSNAISFNSFTPASGNHTFDDGTEVPYASPANIERIKEAPLFENDNIRLYGRLDYNLIEGLTVSGEYTFQKSNSDIITSDNQVLTVNPERFILNAVDPVNTFFRKQNSKSNYSAINVFAKYDLGLNDHNFSLLAGFNQEETSNESFWVRKSNLINVNLPSISAASGTVTGDDGYFEWAVRGYFGRLNYNFKEKYFFEANGRYDGSSRFPEDSRYGFFPSFSAGWHIGREDFIPKTDFLSSLKLRASWGQVGNQIVRDRNGNQVYYPAIPGMAIINASWLNENSGTPYVTLNPPELVSASFSWETVETLNFGLDASFFKNRLSTSLDIYERKTLDMIVPGVELPAVLGADAPTQNAADLKTKGWELSFNWLDGKNDFNYNIGFNISDNQSEITKFDNPAGLISQFYEGQEIGEIWGYTTVGYYTTDDFVEGTLDENLRNGTLKDGIPFVEGRNPNPGDIRYADLNGDGIINDGNNTLNDPGDRSIIGNDSRRYQFGINANVSYKSFDLAVLLNGIGSRDIYENNSVRFPYTNEFQVVYISQLDYWTPENPNGFFPRNYALGGVNYGVNRWTQTKYLLDGAYLRLKNVTLGYTLPAHILDKINIDNLRVYIAGENLLDFNDYPDGINTELQNKGNGAIYPFLKIYSFGLNMSF